MLVFAKSDDFVGTYPYNKNNNFRIRLLRERKFAKTARLALLQLIVPPLAKDTLANVLCSAITYSQRGEEDRRLLRVVHLKASENYQHFEFDCPLYLDLLDSTVSEIRFSLKNQDNTYITFKKEDQPTTVLFEIVE
jgi:hypothetical protein